MADKQYFVDGTSGGDGDAGTDMDLAFETTEFAFEKVYTPSNNDRTEVFFRRSINEVQNDDIAVGGNGAANSPLDFMGFPRNKKTGTADFTNGESVITDFSIVTGRSLYCGRRIKNDTDAKWYLATAVCMKIIYDNQQGGESFSKGDTVVSDNGDPGEGKVQMVIDNDPVGVIWIVVRGGTFANDDEMAIGATHIADINGTPDADDGLCIDREFEGSTEDDGNFTIQEDEDYHRVTDTFAFTGATNDIITTASNNVWQTGELLFVYSDDTLPAGLAANTQYFYIRTGADTGKLASSRANAFAGTPVVDITDTGTGTHTIQHIDDFAWTIQMSDWNGDADTLPIIDFDDLANGFNSNVKSYMSIKYFEFRDSSDSAALFYFKRGNSLHWLGIHLLSDQNKPLFSVVGTRGKARRMILVGNSVGSSQVGISVSASTKLNLKELAIYNLGDSGINVFEAMVEIDNVNIGVELGNDDDDISITSVSRSKAKDVLVGGANGDFLVSGGRQPFNGIQIENYQKVLGEHRQILPNSAYIAKNDGSGADVNLRGGGGASVLEYSSPNSQIYATHDEWAYELFTAEFKQAASTTKTYKWYIQNDELINASDAYGASNIWLEADVLGAYEDTSEYTYQKDSNGYYLPRSVSSNNPMPVKADNDDWGEYIEIEITTPAIDCIVKITGKVNYYHATGKIFIDVLKPSIT